MILLIDNYDSFTFNLFQYFGELGEEIKVHRNNEITIAEIIDLNPEAIILSPGPGRPEAAGICVELIQTLYQKFPILGICLGHQAIGYSFGATIDRAKQIMHGKQSRIEHSCSELFRGIPKQMDVMRYHSLVIEKESLPTSFIITAISKDDEEMMAIQHQEYPLYGVQFHPESIGTANGKEILRNFLNQIRKVKAPV